MNVTNINDLSTLMDEWREKHEQDKTKHESNGEHLFTADGIVDENCYGVGVPKICFLLEECYFDTEELGVENPSKHWYLKMSRVNHSVVYRLNEDIRDNDPWYMWYRVEEMTKTILQAYGVEKENARHYISICDIKKSKGRPQSVLYEPKKESKKKEYYESGITTIESCGREDKDLLRKELELLAPDILVCGRVFEVALNCDLIDKKELFELPYDFDLGSGLRKAYRVGKMLVLDTWHPSSSFSYELLEAQRDKLRCIISEVFK